MTGMTENTFLNIEEPVQDHYGRGGGAGKAAIARRNRHWQGGRFGGWALYVKDGKPAYDYNFLGMQRFTVAANEIASSPPGKSTIRFDFAYDGGGAGKAEVWVRSTSTTTRSVKGVVERTQPAIFSADEPTDVGIDLATPVVEVIGANASRASPGISRR